jgi:hypothetical protein
MKHKNAQELLNGYYNFLMDEFNGYASEEAIEMFLTQEGINDNFYNTKYI